ncbi:MAG: rRNA adenine N-6-methyltransferase family protein [Candidatus Peregrinibacteria bacterium]
MGFLEAAEFFVQGVRHPFSVGSVFPTPPRIVRAVVDLMEVRRGDTVLELGPGSGAFTREILHRMGEGGDSGVESSQLIAIELIEGFARRLHAITGGNGCLRVVHGTAADLRRILCEHRIGQADRVLSGIPFSTLSEHEGRAIVFAVKEVLAPQGRFIAYQNYPRVRDFMEEVFPCVEEHKLPWHFPSLTAYSARRNGRTVEH